MRREGGGVAAPPYVDEEGRRRQLSRRHRLIERRPGITRVLDADVPGGEVVHDSDDLAPLELGGIDPAPTVAPQRKSDATADDVATHIQPAGEAAVDDDGTRRWMRDVGVAERTAGDELHSEDLEIVGRHPRHARAAAPRTILDTDRGE